MNIFQTISTRVKPTLVNTLVVFASCILLFGFFAFKNSSIITEPNELELAFDECDQVEEKESTTKNKRIIHNNYAKTEMDSVAMPFIDNKVVHALESQQAVLTKMKGKKIRIGNRSVNAQDLLETVNLLLSWQYSYPGNLSNFFDFYEVNASKKDLNVKFTGYFTPIIKVSKKYSKRFRYPLYAFPQDWENALPSREDIDGSKKVLEGKGLELAYAENKIDIYYMQMQGSGVVEYPNGTKELFIYAGNNGHSFRSISRFLQRSEDHDIKNLTSTGIKKYLEKNPNAIDSVLFKDKSYVFFEKKHFKMPEGATNVPLTGAHSIAVDPKHIPLGSCLLGAVPMKKHGVMKHQLQFLVAQDVGGAINGAGHVDLYCGLGKDAQDRADKIHSNGKLWVMLPKKGSKKVTNKPLIALN